MNKAEAHKILGTTDSMSEVDIKKVVRGLRSKWHPDKNPGNEEKAKKEFQKIQEAVEVLEGKNPSPEASSPWSSTPPNFEDILRNFGFGGFNFQGGGHYFSMDDYTDNWVSSGPGAPRSHSKPRVQVINAQIPITLEEAFNGCTKMIDIPNPTSISGSPTQVIIPPGLSEQELIKELATPEANIRLFIKIQSEYHVTFGNLLNSSGAGDILKELRISPFLMMTGGFLDIVTIDGGTVSARIPEGLEANTIIKLKGKGYWTSSKRQYRGDCLLKIIPHIQKVADLKREELDAFLKAVNA